MRSSRTNYLYSLMIVLTLLALSACGQLDDSIGDFGGIDPFNGDVTDPIAAAETRAAQTEVNSVMQDVQSVVMGGLTGNQTVSLGDCSPQSEVDFSGAYFTFDGLNGCNLKGEIVVRYFPLSAFVNLEVVGLEYVESLNYQADISLSGTQTVVIDWKLLDGRIQLKNIDFLSESEIVLNGRVNAVIGEGISTVQGRTNVFGATTRTGFSLLLNAGNDGTHLQGCMLQGGVPNDPDAGVTLACRSILN